MKFFAIVASVLFLFSMSAMACQEEPKGYGAQYLEKQGAINYFVRRCSFEYPNPSAMVVGEAFKRRQAEAGNMRWCSEGIHQKDFQKQKYVLSCALRDEQLLDEIRTQITGR